MKKQPYIVPENKRIRVIIDTDTYAEADDQFAIAHALLTPKFEVVGIVATHFKEQNSMEDSYDEIKRVLDKMKLTGKVNVYRGASACLQDEKNPIQSEGVEMIINEALKEDPRPLFILNMGAVTNLASALLIEPKIAEKMIAVWIGGGAYPTGGTEFNALNDLIASNVLFGSSVELWQIPLSAYTQMEVSFHELYDKVAGCGEIGKYLFDNLLRVNKIACERGFDLFFPFAEPLSEGAKTMWLRSSEGWSLGDNPAVGVLILGQWQNVDYMKAKYINAEGVYCEEVVPERKIRVYHSINSRLILEDMFAKLKYHYE